MHKASLYLFGILFALVVSTARADPGFGGTWKIDPELSTAIDPWSRITLEVAVDGDRVTIEETVSTGRRGHTQTVEIDVSKDINRVPVDWWIGNRHIGAYMPAGGAMKVRGEWLDDGRTLALRANFELETSQGTAPVRTYTEYRLDRGGERLVRMRLRSTRELPILHVFTRE